MPRDRRQLFDQTLAKDKGQAFVNDGSWHLIADLYGQGLEGSNRRKSVVCLIAACARRVIPFQRFLTQQGRTLRLIAALTPICPQ